jgi:hypothetical protein
VECLLAMALVVAGIHAAANIPGVASVSAACLRVFLLFLVFLLLLTSLLLLGSY